MLKKPKKLVIAFLVVGLFSTNIFADNDCNLRKENNSNIVEIEDVTAIITGACLHL